MSLQRLWRVSALLFLPLTVISPAAEVGDVAPEFTLTKATDQQEVKLSDFHGTSNVVLTTLTQIDGAFISQLEDHAEGFQAKYDAVSIPVVPEAREQVIAFMENAAISGIELYSDPARTVAAAYGASQITANEKTAYQPTTFVIDKSGHIRWTFYGETDSDLPAMEQLESELAKLKRNTPLPIGSPAPDFSLTEADGKTTFTLSEQQGKKNVLVTLLLQTY